VAEIIGKPKALTLTIAQAAKELKRKAATIHRRIKAETIKTIPRNRTRISSPEIEHHLSAS